MKTTNKFLIAGTIGVLGIAFYLKSKKDKTTFVSKDNDKNSGTTVDNVSNLDFEDIKEPVSPVLPVTGGLSLAKPPLVSPGKPEKFDGKPYRPSQEEMEQAERERLRKKKEKEVKEFSFFEGYISRIKKSGGGSRALDNLLIKEVNKWEQKLDDYINRGLRFRVPLETQLKESEIKLQKALYELNIQERQREAQEREREARKEAPLRERVTRLRLERELRARLRPELESIRGILPMFMGRGADAGNRDGSISSDRGGRSNRDGSISSDRGGRSNRDGSISSDRGGRGNRGNTGMMRFTGDASDVNLLNLQVY